MSSKYFSYVADYVPNRGTFPTEGRWVDLTIKTASGNSEAFGLKIEKAPLSRGQLFSFRIKTRTSALPGSLFLTAEAVALVDWSPVHHTARGAILTLPPGEEIP